MIYATIKSVKEYDVVMDSGNIYGLYQSYSHNPPLLALILIGTPIPYEYEGTMEPGKCQVVIKHIDVFKDTLEEIIGQYTISGLLKSLNPLEFYDKIKEYDLSELPIVKFVYHNDQDQFKVMVGARAAAWGLSYKGAVGHKGNVTAVQFGGSKQSLDVPEDLQVLHHTLLGRYANG